MFLWMETENKYMNKKSVGNLDLNRVKRVLQEVA